MRDTTSMAPFVENEITYLCRNSMPKSKRVVAHSQVNEQHEESPTEMGTPLLAPPRVVVQPQAGVPSPHSGQSN